MPTDRIEEGEIKLFPADYPAMECHDPEHNPPKHLAPGRYLHICPKCGKQQIVRVRGKNSWL